MTKITDKRGLHVCTFADGHPGKVLLLPDEIQPYFAKGFYHNEEFQLQEIDIERIIFDLTGKRGCVLPPPLSEDRTNLRLEITNYLLDF